MLLTNKLILSKNKYHNQEGIIEKILKSNDEVIYQYKKGSEIE